MSTSSQTTPTREKGRASLRGSPRTALLAGEPVARVASEGSGDRGRDCVEPGSSAAGPAAADVVAAVEAGPWAAEAPAGGGI
ncbi:hypothetical protein ACVWXU_005968 [Streptomyces sp. TE33382]